MAVTVWNPAFFGCFCCTLQIIQYLFSSIIGIIYYSENDYMPYLVWYHAFLLFIGIASLILVLTCTAGPDDILGKLLRYVGIIIASSGYLIITIYDQSPFINFENERDRYMYFAHCRAMMIFSFPTLIFPSIPMIQYKNYDIQLFILCMICNIIGLTMYSLLINYHNLASNASKVTSNTKMAKYFNMSFILYIAEFLSLYIFSGYIYQNVDDLDVITIIWIILIAVTIPFSLPVLFQIYMNKSFQIPLELFEWLFDRKEWSHIIDKIYSVLHSIYHINIPKYDSMEQNDAYLLKSHQATNIEICARYQLYFIKLNRNNKRKYIRHILEYKSLCKSQFLWLVFCIYMILRIGLIGMTIYCALTKDVSYNLMVFIFCIMYIVVMFCAMVLMVWNKMFFVEYYYGYIRSIQHKINHVNVGKAEQMTNNIVQNSAIWKCLVELDINVDIATVILSYSWDHT